MQSLKKINVVILLCFYLNVTNANPGISYSSYGKKIQINVPTPSNGGAPPDVLITNNGNNFTFATGKLGVAAASKSVPLRNELLLASDPQNSGQATNPDFNQLSFMVDQNGRRIGALYPLLPYRGIYVTALHVLKNAKFEDQSMNKSMLFGFRNRNTGDLYDIAILVEDSEVNQLITFLKEASFSPIEIGDQIYAKHLNLIDEQREISLSGSKSQIASFNLDYFYFLNRIHTIVGPSSSGSVVYNAKHQPTGIILCESNVINQENTEVIRALRFSILQSNHMILLNPSDIQEFKPLDCKNFDSRGAGG